MPPPDRAARRVASQLTTQTWLESLTNKSSLTFSKAGWNSLWSEAFGKQLDLFGERRREHDGLARVGLNKGALRDRPKTAGS